MKNEEVKQAIQLITKHVDNHVYAQIFATFDIETSVVEIEEDKIPFMYHWAFCIKDCIVHGRTWSEYFQFVRMIDKALDDHKLRIYVHNLAFDGKFLSGAFRFKKDWVFCDGETIFDSNKIYKVMDNYHNLDYRCSYLLTGEKLSEFTAHTKHPKLDDFDYDEIRYPWTPLTDQELNYVDNDVLGLWEALEDHFRAIDQKTITDDNPLTDQSFVRKECKSAYAKEAKYQEFTVKDLKGGTMPEKALYIHKPTYEQYKLLAEDARGGNFYSSRRWRGVVVKDVIDPDAKSHYPTTLVLDPYPWGPWKEYETSTLEELKNLMGVQWCWCARISFENLRLKDANYGFPYLEQKTQKQVKEGKATNQKCSDGRILSADHYETVLLSAEWPIIEKMYDWDSLTVGQMICAQTRRLPSWLASLIIKYFTNKECQQKHTVAYGKAKVMINGISGSIGRKFEKYMADTRANYNDFVKKNPWYNYAWYPFMTAHARRRLQEVIDIDEPNCLYCALDSVKTKSDFDLSKVNEKIIEEDEEIGAFAKVEKEVHPMGVWEPEYQIKRFVTFGTGRYIMELSEPIELDEKTRAYAKTKGFTDDQLDNFNVMAVINGANKLDISLEIFRKGIENLRPGDSFPQRRQFNTPFIIDGGLMVLHGKEHDLEVCSGVLIETVDMDYTLKLTKEVSDFGNLSD